MTLSLNSHTVLDFYKHPRFLEEGETTVPSTATMATLTTVEDKEAQSAMQDKQEDGGEEGLRRPTPEFSLLVQRGSLLVLKDQMYTHYMHGIAPRTSDTVAESMVNFAYCGVKVGQTFDRRTRMSLTFRVVEKVVKAKLF